MKLAFITGITGQDGSYLAELLLHQLKGKVSLNI
jgi:GDP-D-mannose dehydratase